MRRFARLITMSAVACACTLGGAQAQTCYTMQAELIHLLGQGQGGVADRGRYERAYREQANVIARTERRARDAGCFGGGFFLFRREPSRECRTVVPKLREMQDNLARLDQLRRRAGSDNAYRVRELQGMLQARGCDLPGRSLFNRSPDRDWLWEDDSLYSARGTYRTLCVRTCDGYYFPISFSTTRDQLPADAQSCQAMCPGAQSELFYHPNPGGGPETMVSILGAPYTSLPTAFQYRTSFNPSCSCRPAGGYSVTTQTAQGFAPADDPTAPLPRPRPEPGEDPETLANRAGDLVPRAAAPATAETTAMDNVVTGADGKPVRVVGPAYWGEAEHDDVIIAPVPN